MNLCVFLYGGSTNGEIAESLLNIGIPEKADMSTVIEHAYDFKIAGLFLKLSESFHILFVEDVVVGGS